MKSSAPRSPARIRYLLAVGVGALQAVCFPSLSLAPLAWLVPGALLLLAIGQPGRTALRIGYYAGLSHYLISLHWLLLIPLPVHAVLAWLAVSAVLAFYTAGWTWFCVRIFRRAGSQSPNFGQTEPKPAKERFARAAANGVPQSLWPLICACGWVAMEMGIGRIFTGFPWNLLGASQYKSLALIQIASIAGVYGVSFIVVWVSVAIGLTVFRLRASTGLSPALVPPLAPAVVGLLAILGFGIHQLASREPTQRELLIALVQPSIPQLIIWDEKEKTNRFNTLVALSQQAVAAHPDLLVWPEAALPNLLTRFNPVIYSAVTNLVIPNHCWMILGANDAEPKKDAANPAEADFFNSAFLIEPSGQLVGRYHKQRLVMFGEYMPLSRWLPFLKYLRTINGGFTPGDRPVPFYLGGLNVKISVLICFEDIFPHLARNSASSETDFLLNLTNDGWFHESAAQWQHAVSSLFRAVENGLPLVRCTNNGLTCWIDSRGAMHEVFFPGSRDIYRSGIKFARIPLGLSDDKRGLTFYNRHGDWFGWTCVCLSALAFMKRTWEARQTRRHLQPGRLPSA